VVAQIDEDAVETPAMERLDPFHHFDPRAVETVNEDHRPPGVCRGNPPAGEADAIPSGQRNVFARDGEGLDVLGVLLVGQAEPTPRGDASKGVGNHPEEEDDPGEEEDHEKAFRPAAFLPRGGGL
jgi:hypothetical protein